MSQHQIICGCYYEHSDGKTPGHIISCPLHAAAPALLEALEEMLKEGTTISYDEGEAWERACSKARAAIAQAKGVDNGS